MGVKVSSFPFSNGVVFHCVICHVFRRRQSVPDGTDGVVTCALVHTGEGER